MMWLCYCAVSKYVISFSIGMNSNDCLDVDVLPVGT